MSIWAAMLIALATLAASAALVWLLEVLWLRRYDHDESWRP